MRTVAFGLSTLGDGSSAHYISGRYAQIAHVFDLMDACGVPNAITIHDDLLTVVFHPDRTVDAGDEASRNVHDVQQIYLDPCRLKVALACARLSFLHHRSVLHGVNDVSIHLATDVHEDGAHDGTVVGVLCCFVKLQSSGTLSFGRRSSA